MKQIYMLISILLFSATTQAMDINSYPDYRDETASFHAIGSYNENHIDNIIHASLYTQYANKIVKRIHNDINNQNMKGALGNVEHLVDLMDLSRIPKAQFLTTAQNFVTLINNKADKKSLSKEFSKVKEKLNMLSLA